MVNTVRKLFPGKNSLPSVSGNPYYAVTSQRTGLRVLADGLSSYLARDEETAGKREGEQRELLRIYEGAEGKWMQTVSSILRSAAKSGLSMQIDTETAARLYGSVLNGNITRLEEFAKCPFMQFADYGLKLKERETFTVEKPDIGNLLQIGRAHV